MQTLLIRNNNFLDIKDKEEHIHHFKLMHNTKVKKPFLYLKCSEPESNAEVNTPFVLLIHKDHL